VHKILTINSWIVQSSGSEFQTSGMATEKAQFQSMRHSFS